MYEPWRDYGHCSSTPVPWYYPMTRACVSFLECRYIMRHNLDYNNLEGTEHKVTMRWWDYFPVLRKHEIHFQFSDCSSWITFFFLSDRECQSSVGTTHTTKIIWMSENYFTQKNVPLTPCKEKSRFLCLFWKIHTHTPVNPSSSLKRFPRILSASKVKAWCKDALFIPPNPSLEEKKNLAFWHFSPVLFPTSDE